MNDGVMLTVGRDKRKVPLAEAGERDLRYYAEKGYNEGIRSACAAELERRGLAASAPAAAPADAAAPAPRAQAPSAIQRSAPATSVSLFGSHADGRTVTQVLTQAQAQAHLVTPSTVCGSLPEGCEVAVSLVSVNPAVEAGDVYPLTGGKLGLGKVALDRIGAAAGVTWDPVLSRRIDDGRDPYFCAFQAVGYLRGFDGSVRTITGTKEMDMRDGSPQIVALNERKRDGSSADRQVREMRLHILAHAETKAKLRAIRSIGIKTSYTPEELSRPFAVARLMFTGRTSNPILAEKFAMMTAEAMLGGARALYGAPADAPTVPRLAAPATPAQLADDDDAWAPMRAPSPDVIDRGDDPDNY